MRAWIARLLGRRPGGMMSCHEVGKVLQRYLDGHVDDAEQARRIAGHLDDCLRCGMEAETYQRIKDALAAQRPVVPPTRSSGCGRSVSAGPVARIRQNHDRRCVPRHRHTCFAAGGPTGARRLAGTSPGCFSGGPPRSNHASPPCSACRANSAVWRDGLARWIRPTATRPWSAT